MREHFTFGEASPPLGALLTSPLITGAEAPGWPYVAPVGGFRK